MLFGISYKKYSGCFVSTVLSIIAGMLLPASLCVALPIFIDSLAKYKFDWGSFMFMIGSAALYFTLNKLADNIFEWYKKFQHEKAMKEFLREQQRQRLNGGRPTEEEIEKKRKFEKLDKIALWGTVIFILLFLVIAIILDR